MNNEIIVHKDQCFTLVGALAHKLAFESRSEVPCFQAGRNKFFVMEAPQSIGDFWILRAGQSTREGALRYMTENRVLVDVSGTNPSHLEMTRENFTPTDKPIFQV